MGIVQGERTVSFDGARVGGRGPEDKRTRASDWHFHIHLRHLARKVGTLRERGPELERCRWVLRKGLCCPLCLAAAEQARVAGVHLR